MHFIDSIENDKQLVNSGENGLAVVRMLEACDQSIKQDGRPVELKRLDSKIQVSSVEIGDVL
jgi:predicted dehydrogenase